MTSPQQDPSGERYAHLRDVLDQARSLSQARPGGPDGVAWLAQTAHVGDLSVLALALRD